MTPTQQKQIEHVKTRIRHMRAGGAAEYTILPQLRREGWPEAAIREAMGG